MKSLGIYIHIPFCVRKCYYCDFLSSTCDEETKKQYVQALKKEISNESKKYREFEVDTIFFGGGTPSILIGEDLASILKCIKDNFCVSYKAEITTEMNPATADEEKLKKLKEAGFNRISIGLQSAKDDELKMIGRIHSYQDFISTYNAARRCGFTNINIDLMSALPGQTCSSFTETLNTVIALNPEHISAYSLILEENTYLYDNLHKFPEIPSEEEDRLIYQETQRILKTAGYDRYEISNYSKPGFICRHNDSYWTRRDYVGFGIGAASLVNEKRWKNNEDLNTYIMGYLSDGRFDSKEDIQELSIQDQMEEFMFLGLRRTDGISISEFNNKFGKDINDIYGKIIEKWTNLGYLTKTDTNVSLTERGIDVSNQILSEFLF